MTAAALRAFRERYGVSQRWLAGVLGVSLRSVASMEAGSRPDGPWRDHLDRLHAITLAPTPERPHRVVIDLDAPPGPEPR